MADPKTMKTDLELYSALLEQKWTKCAEILRSKTELNPNICDKKGWNCLHIAVHQDQYSLVALLMKRGANPFLMCEYGNNIRVSSIQMSTFFKPDPRMVHTLTVNVIPEIESRNLVGCCLLRMGDTRLASQFFFGSDAPIQRFRLFERWVQVARSMPNFTKAVVQQLFCILIENQRILLEDTDYLQIIIFLIHATDFSYTTVAITLGVLLRTRFFSPYAIFQVAEIICMAPIDPLRDPLHLYDSIVKIASRILYSAQLGQCTEDLVPKLGIVIDRFETKNLLLVNEEVLQAPLRLVRFLVGRCSCDPNFKNKDGDTVLHLLLKEGAYWDQETRAKVASAVLTLLEHGAHQCVRNAKGDPAVNMFWKLGWPSVVRTLQCLAASKIVEAKIDYSSLSKKELKIFVDLH